MALEWYWVKRKWESTTGCVAFQVLHSYFHASDIDRTQAVLLQIHPKERKTPAQAGSSKDRAQSTSHVRKYVYFLCQVSSPLPSPTSKHLTDPLLRQNSGDIESLKSTCLEGVVASLRSRINSRRPDEKVRWTLHKYIGRPRIVSTKIAALPDMDTSALYQVVVQIKSVQSLKGISKGRNAEKDTVVEDSKGKQNGVVEYLVMQKMMLRGREGSWKIWGTTEETDVKDVWKEQSSKPKARSPAVAK